MIGTHWLAGWKVVLLLGRTASSPYFISAADGGLLRFAGLWERWKNPETPEPVSRARSSSRTRML